MNSVKWSLKIILKLHNRYSSSITMSSKHVYCYFCFFKNDISTLDVNIKRWVFSLLKITLIKYRYKLLWSYPLSNMWKAFMVLTRTKFIFIIHLEMWDLKAPLYTCHIHRRCILDRWFSDILNYAYVRS